MTNSLCSICVVWLIQVLDDLFPEPEVFTEEWYEQEHPHTGVQRLYKRHVFEIVLNRTRCWLCCHLYLASGWLPHKPIQQPRILNNEAVPLEVHCRLWHYQRPGIEQTQFVLFVGLEEEVGDGFPLYINLEGSRQYRKPVLQQASIRPRSPSGQEGSEKPPISFMSTSAECSRDKHQEEEHERLIGGLCACRTQIVRTWLHTCSNSHKKCAKLFSASDAHPGPPTRLIMIGERLNQCRLIETTSELKAQGVVYATLSHCWGRDPIITLTRSNYHEFRRQIPIYSLTKTFKEALAICQTLGIRYLWIDSLCIIQDSENKEDWTKEAPRMQSVYGGSFLNLAANASKKGAEGLIRPHLDGVGRAFRVQLGETVVVSFSADDARLFQERVFTGCPLVSRGWVMQELFLSPRKLHFTESQLIWQCNEQIWAEQLEIREGKEGLKIDYVYSNALDTILEPRELDDLWTRLLADFCRMNLTESSDVLFALSGVAAAFHNRYEKLGFQTQYVAGYWEHDLWRCFQWHRDSRRSIGRLNPKHPFLPSWSCIRSVPDHISIPAVHGAYYPQEGFAPSHLEVARVHVRYASPDQRFNSFDSLTVEVCASAFDISKLDSSTSDCSLYRLRVHIGYHDSDNISDRSGSNSAANSTDTVLRDNREDVAFGFSWDDEANVSAGQTLVCAIINTWGFAGIWNPTPSINALLLKPSLVVGSDSITTRVDYQRVGKLRMSSNKTDTADGTTFRVFFHVLNLPSRILSLI